MVDPLEEAFPRLAEHGYTITSARSKRYNCIAWAAGDTRNWWWPIPEADRVYWPTGVARAETVPAFRDAYASLGYVVSDADKLEPGFEKIALFANSIGLPLHAARQLVDGRWTSKLGELEDIEHELHDLEGTSYGSVVLLMKRPIAAG